MPDQINPSHYTDPITYAGEIERMHPEAYRRILPYIEDTVAGIRDAGALTEDDINEMAYRAVRNSGIAASPPRGYSESALADIARVLIVAGLYRQLWGTPPFFPGLPFPNCPNPWQPCWPYTFFPVFPWFPSAPVRPPIRPGRPPFNPGRPSGGRPPGRPPFRQGRPGGGRQGGRRRR